MKDPLIEKSQIATVAGVFTQGKKSMYKSCYLHIYKGIKCNISPALWIETNA